MSLFNISLISSFAFTALLLARPQEIEMEKLVLIDTMDKAEVSLTALKENALWRANLKEALDEAKSSGKPLLVVILGGKSCPWSDKLQQEVLIQKAFLGPLEKECILFRGDLLSLQQRNSGLLLQEEIKELPQVLIFTPEGQEISRSGYVTYEPALFAKRILAILQGYNELSLALAKQEDGQWEDADLEAMYQKASEIGCFSIKEKLLGAGVQRKKNLFFLLEQYADLLSKGKKKEPETKKLRQTIQSLDPKNSKGAQRKMAILEFEEGAKLKKKPENPLAVVKPLIEYVERFNKSDSEHIWKIEMMIAEYLFSKNKLSDALNHAEASYSLAPDLKKEEILDSLNYLKEQKKKAESPNP